MAEIVICASCGGENPTTMRFCGHCGSSLEAGPDTSDADVAEALKSFVSQQLADRLVEDEGRINEERRLVTALFADLSGFTPLADRLDPEELLEVIDPVINRLTTVVGRYEGYVDKFAGDALLAFFGAPTAHEDDADRALLVALEMHKELEQMLPDLPEDAQGLTLHTGVNTGHVIARVLGTEVRMDYSVLGDAVILAQRLESAAPAGETYVGDLTHLLTRERFLFEPVGNLTLKGKVEPVPAWRLTGARPRQLRSTSPRFVGRKKELETARLVLDGLVEGTGAVVTLSGEPGVGKSRLTAEIMSQARRSGIFWLTGRCLSYGSAVAYWPFADLFRSLFGTGPDEDHEVAITRIESMLSDFEVAATTPYIARFLGFATPELDDLDPEAFQNRLREAVGRVLTAISLRLPLVVAIEDLHWGDPSSVALVTDLAHLCTTHRIALYLTARVEAIPVLVEVSSSAPDFMRHTFRLERFMQDEIEELVTDLLEGVPPPGLAFAIAERSAGNPFFAEELVRSMQEAGHLNRVGDGWVAHDVDAATLPPTVEGVLSSRIDLLPRRTATVLQEASVIGRRVRIPILHKLDEARDLDKELEILVDRAYLETTGDPDELVFHHALVQEAAYSRLLRKQRRELHRQVAQVAEGLYGAADDVIDLLARHLYLGQAGQKAIDYLVRAGARSKGLFANEEAILHYSRAAELARADKRKDRTQLDEILLELGDLHEIRGQYEDASTLYDEVRAASADVRAWRGLASSLRNQSRYDDVYALIERAFEACDFTNEEKAALWLERGWALVREGRFEESEDAFKRGLDSIADTKDLVAAELLLQLAGAETAMGGLESALENAQKATDIFEAEGSLRGQTSAMRIFGDAYRELGRYDEAAAALRRGIELAEHTGSVEEKGGCLINLGRVEMDRERLEDAIACFRGSAREFESIGHPMGRAISYANLAETLVMHGEHEEAYTFANKAKDLGLNSDAPLLVADANVILALIHTHHAEHLRAAELSEEAGKIQEELGLADEAGASYERAAEALEKAGEKERAPELRSRALSFVTNASD